MKKTMMIAGAGFAFGVSLATAHAADKVTIQLKWVAQAQFAGYFVAKEKGFYKEAGLDVTINPGGPDVAPPQVIAGGGADLVVDWMPSALASREKGVPLVNISQTARAWSSSRRRGRSCHRASLNRQLRPGRIFAALEADRK